MRKRIYIIPKHLKIIYIFNIILFILMMFIFHIPISIPIWLLFILNNILCVGIVYATFASMFKMRCVEVDKLDIDKEEILQRINEDKQHTIYAVKYVLLFNLPLALRQKVKDIPYLNLFLAIDGVVKLLIRNSQHYNRNEFDIFLNGDIKSNGIVVIPSSTVIREITRMSRLCLEQSKLISMWIPIVAHFQQNIFLGAKIVQTNEDFVRVKICRRDNHTNLIKYWEDGVK